MARVLLAPKAPTAVPDAQSLQDLARSLERRDPPTRGHAQRVAAYAYRLATWLGWDASTARRLELAGLIHDIGKVAVPAVILTKPSALTDAERAVVQLHPTVGEEFCRPLLSQAEVLAVIRHHHERWDGRGYPDRLKGRAIPLWARIMAIADSFDALTSDRAYRHGLAIDQALAVLRAGAGEQWDPDLVALFVAMRQAQSRPLAPAAWTSILVAADADQVGPLEPVVRDGTVGPAAGVHLLSLPRPDDRPDR
jgi:putative nucleotidyltransferase with HDIG domain